MIYIGFTTDDLNPNQGLLFRSDSFESVHTGYDEDTDNYDSDHGDGAGYGHDNYGDDDNDADGDDAG